MDSLDPTERALAERVEIRRQQLREAEDGLELYRRDVEVQRQIALDHALAVTLQETENLEQRLRDEDEDTDSDFDEVEVRDDPDQRTCVTCLDDLSDQDAHRCPCRHDWCETCIVNRYDMAAKSTHLFPAQCCGQPILPDNHELIAPETWTRYFQKKAEVETPNPTFCSKRDCSKFIPLHDISEGQAKCVCGHVTCVECKAGWHIGECVVDPETEQLLNLAQEQNWQRCFHCRVMVDRLDGCNEIGTSNMLAPLNQASLKACTNRFAPECKNCEAKFCYACGKEWKTCPCPQFGRHEPADQPPAEAMHIPHIWAMLRHPHDFVVRVEVDSTEAPIEETVTQPEQVPWSARLRGLVRPVVVDSTDASVEEAAVDETVPAVTPTTERRMPPRLTDAHLRNFRSPEPEGRPGRAGSTISGCDEHSWRRVGGGGTCETCDTVMPNFLFQCRTCGHTSCHRCR